ncbi:NAD(P)-binding protein [Coniophora puteana RWD-64-598 SS2]|uniref:NAD(P)-binding protein n=1 Tax=Coniophora puteana (strain RWD-64-598) TaxID=741705 RepID=A0A5M3MUR1_CONPW|nr:NAD(P)-binding protein [Coniophora puteana RWD-64-598 SS2]EIW82912.1 NAD(P)-binding protein [Coniophora puteana RWD-64-598 SS2]
MRAYVVNEYAHPSKLPLSLDTPTPAPKVDEVIVDVYSAGLNYFDILQAQGKYQTQPPFPWVLGAEFAGKIAEDSPIPKGCPFKRGDRVFGSAQGCYADKVAAKANSLLPLPDNVSFDQGAGLYITWATSYEALVGRANLKAGEWILVHAAAGGVGIAAVQLAKAVGAKVIAAAGSSEKLDVCRRYGGADHAINYNNKDWPKEVMKLTGGKGVDVVYDPVGHVRDSLKCIAFKGRFLIIGFAGGSIPELKLNLVLLKNVSLIGLLWGNYSKLEPTRVVTVWKELLALLASNKVKPVMYSKIYPLEEMGQGLIALEQRKTWGKVIVHVKDENKRIAAKL